MKGRFLLLIAILSLVCLALILVQVNAQNYSWKDDFNYATLQQMQDAGWVLENIDGTRLDPEGVVIDGTGVDTVIRYRNRFPGGIYDWNVETRSMWSGTGHSGPGVNVVTTRHVYGIFADGWYNQFGWSRDSESATFGSYQEEANVWVTMNIVKIGNTVSVYLNNRDLIYTYVEVDTEPSELIGVERIAPWKGVMLYDYYQVTSLTEIESPAGEWYPEPVNAVVAAAVGGVVVGASSVAVAAAVSPVGAPVNKVADGVRNLLPSSVKRWLASLMASKRKTDMVDAKGSVFIPTKPEIMAYCFSMVVLAVCFSYVEVNSLGEIWTVLPTVFATSIVVAFVKAYPLVAYARSRGVWGEYRLWYLGLVTFLLTTVVFRVPFSSPSRSVFHKAKVTEKLSVTFACASVLISLAFAGVFFALLMRGFIVVGSTGLAMCLISAFFDTFPIAPMGGRVIFDFSKKLWVALFVATLVLYFAWLLLL